MTSDQGGGEKTEKATPKKRQDARKEGQVLKSAEVNTAVLTLAMFAVLALFGRSMTEKMLEQLSVGFDRLSTMPTDLTANDMHLLIVDAVWQMILLLLPMFIAAIVVGVVVNIAQVGFLFTAKAIAPKFSKINPLQGLKRMFSMRSLVEMLKAILKIGIVGFVVYLDYMSHLEEFPGMINLTVAQAGGEIFSICISVAFKAVIALVGIGLADFLYQWWEFEKNLKMSKQEIKQEYKTQEGDPQIKAKRREKQRQMSTMRMMQDIPKADVVITNPTHYAIAIQYDDKVAPAPIVLAKGKDYVAQKIKEKAKELKIEMVENRPVAQALFVACEIGDSIPDDMFAAVAEILAYVYKLKNPEKTRRK